MKITRDLKSTIYFKDLKCGDVFECNGEINMRIAPLSLISGCSVNSITLSTGLSSSFNYETKVVKVEAELLVKTL